jgi:RNA polymerase sigma factor (TIGR02999 family)
MSSINTSIDETVSLQNARNNNRDIVDDLIPAAYQELRRQAHRYLRGERTDHTLQTTALINEAYLRLIEQKDIRWENRAQFFGLAANMMRRILVDYAKTRHRIKRGGLDSNVSLEQASLIALESTNEKTKLDLIMLDEALHKLALEDEQEARVVELRYFSGLTIEETAEVMGISTMTVKRDWNAAKAWLRREMRPQTKS